MSTFLWGAAAGVLCASPIALLLLMFLTAVGYGEDEDAPDSLEGRMWWAGERLDGQPDEQCFCGKAEFCDGTPGCPRYQKSGGVFLRPTPDPMPADTPLTFLWIPPAAAAQARDGLAQDIERTITGTCGHVANPESAANSIHVHACGQAIGHTNHHKCRCGAYWTARVVT